jgi:hypothetical protein
LQAVNAILYVAEHGCKWRGLPKRFGNWHTIYTRMNRWTKAGSVRAPPQLRDYVLWCGGRGRDTPIRVKQVTGE